MPEAYVRSAVSAAESVRESVQRKLFMLWITVRSSRKNTALAVECVLSNAREMSFQIKEVY